MQKALLSALFIILFLASCKLIDDGSDPGTVGPEDITISLESPNGGESIVEGSAYLIKWSSNATGKLYIAFTFDNELTWYMIADSIANTGVYEWFPVPSTISTQCRVKVTTVDQVASDISDARFSIVKNTNEAVQLISPNGNEQIEAGSQYPIRWVSSEIDSIKLEYTVDNGSHWNLIDIDNYNTGIYYWDPVPNDASTLARIRIMDASDNEPTDMSDSVFTILPEPQIKVLKPNGGETWTVGSNQRIEWYSENIRNIKIDYTVNNGADWLPITAATASIGYYTWENIPSHNSQLCKVRIYDADDGQPNDVSDAPFTITDPVVERSITVIEPNGGEEFEAGTVQDIVWNSNGVELVKIELSINNGISWAALADNYANTGGYQWQINSELNAPQSLIKVSDVADPTLNDQSNSTFRIKPIKSINVTYPTNGLVINAGTPITITWESSGIEKVGIRYTYTNGQPTLDYSGFEVLETSIANQGYYETTFSIPSEQYYVEVFDAETGSPKSRSEGNFKITPQVFPGIEVLVPNGGEEWLTSDPSNRNVYEITWLSSQVENVKIDYSLNGGATWSNIVASTPSNGLYNWEMPQNVAFRSANALIRISDAADESFFDQSDAVFSIHPQNKLLEFIYPNDGEIISPPDSGATAVPAMIWHSAGIYEVRIELSLDNGMTWIELEANFPSTGIRAFEFIYPSSMNARIRITDVSSDAEVPPISDQCDKVFGYNVVE